MSLELTAYTLTNCLGAGNAATLDALRAKRSGLSRCPAELAPLETYVGALAGLAEIRLPMRLGRYDCRSNRLSELALLQDGFADKVAEARARYGAERVGVFLGTSTSGILETEAAYRRRDAAGRLPAGYDYATTQNGFSLARYVRERLELTGPALVVCTACSSTAKVFGNAARLIRAGVCDAAVVGGADTLCLTTLYGFSSLELTSREPCRPFDAERDGISIGEGAGFALLERPRPRSHGPLLLGLGESSDAYHMSTPHPEGLGARLAMERALAAAGLRPSDIDYINLHGTATRTNDAAEDSAVYALFGARTRCSSTKGSTGHLLGAAGITGALISVLAMTHGFIPGSANTRSVDPALKSRYLVDNAPCELRHVLANSFGFGGSNCGVVFACAAT
jgi:3-oxoacyl-[acyl-carrier-protein] synthase I